MRRGGLVWMWAGVASIVFALGWFHASALGQYDFSGTSRFGWLIGYLFSLCLATYAVGLPDRPPGWSGALAAAGAAAVAAVMISLAQLAVGVALLPRFVVLLSAALLVPWAVAACHLTASGVARKAGRDRVLAIVGPTEAAMLVNDLGVARGRPAQLVHTLDPADAGTSERLAELASTDRCTVLVLDRSAQDDERIVGQAALLHMSGLRVRTLTMFYDEWLGKLPISELERVALLFDIGEVHGVTYARVKRILDCTLAVLGTLGLIVLLPGVLLANVLGNRGPMFYRQPRVGKNGGPFTILKFRTMRPGSGGNEWTTERDPRVTPFGQFLRRTHLDELPQVLNVLRGDLSIVGPRPEQPQYVAELSDKIPFYDLRHSVRPGLTGWAQVSFDYASSDQDALEKLQYEFFYLRHQSMALDLRIIGRTVRSVAQRSGR